MNGQTEKHDGASEGDSSSPAGAPQEDPTTTVPPIPKGPPTPLDLPDQEGLDLPRTG